MAGAGPICPRVGPLDVTLRHAQNGAALPGFPERRRATEDQWQSRASVIPMASMGWPAAQ